MKRLIAISSLVTIVWVVVGVGLVYQLPTVLFGETTTIVKTAETERTLSAIPARLSASEQKKSYQSMVFVGDVLLARNVEFLMRTKGGAYPFSGIDLQTVGVAPAVVANFEAAIPAEHIPTPIGMIDFSVPVSAVSDLVAAGYTHLSLGNNHSGDFGKAGYEDTRTALEKLNTFGHYAEVSENSITYLTIAERKIALIGLNALATIDEVAIRQTFAEANRRSELQFVYVHWGEEYALRHNGQQRELAELYVSLGADLIVGHHPHVVQGVELVDSVPVFYSLGNYIFDQYFSKDVQEGLVLSLYDSDGLKINLIPVTSKTTLSQPNYMNPNEHADFLATLARKSDERLRTNIMNGYIMLDVQIASSDKVAMMQGTKRYVQ